jgi:ribosome-binding protein aMBF1 (putative translation factor)
LNRQQCKMARAGLGWGQKGLAHKAGIVPATISDFERQVGLPTSRTIKKMKDAFEQAGVKFIDDGTGVGVWCPKT